MRKAIIGASLVVLATTGTTFAQSAEETVAFITTGVVSGETETNSMVRGVYRERPGSNLTIDFKDINLNPTADYQVYLESVSVKRQSDCKFQVEKIVWEKQKGEIEKRQKAIIVWDFQKLDGFEWKEDWNVWVLPRNYCNRVKLGQEAEQEDCGVNISHNRERFERVKKAFAHLRANFCKARAF